MHLEYMHKKNYIILLPCLVIICIAYNSTCGYNVNTYDIQTMTYTFTRNSKPFRIVVSMRINEIILCSDHYD